jgi:pimeloyl-ACP methyl ester carboxylesterase
MDREREPLPGMVDVGGHRLSMACLGSGQPSVVFDNGVATPKERWGPVPEEVARFATVCIYDRAGTGRSESGPLPRTSARIVDELHTLLHRADIPAPYVLVGHSFGGLNMRLYASRNPEEVAGIVLVDSAHEDIAVRLAPLLPADARAGLLNELLGPNAEGIDVPACATELREAGSLPPVPLIVLSRGLDAAPPMSLPAPVREAVARAWQDLQATLARAVPGGRHVIATRSGHFIQLDEPELVVGAIREIVDATRRPA